MNKIRKVCNSVIFLQNQLAFKFCTAVNKEFTEHNKSQALSQPLIGKIDVFNSFHIDEEHLNIFKGQGQNFGDTLQYCIGQWTNCDVKAIWLKIKEDQLELVEQAVNKGFQLHHCNKDYILLNMWLIKNEQSRLPAYTSHYIGAGGIVINDKNEMLLIRTQNQWDLPGGLIQDEELIIETVEREVLEQTGYQARAQNIWLFRENNGIDINKGNIYFVVLAKLNSKQNKKINGQQECKWINLEKLSEFVSKERISINAELVQILERLDKSKFDKNLMEVTTGEREFHGTKKKFSVYKPVI